MNADSQVPPDKFATWLLHRIAQAVEAGEVSEALLREVQEELLSQDALFSFDSYEMAVRQLQELGGVSREEADAALEMMREYPEGMGERFIRWLADGWLEGRRRAYRHRRPG
jgi:hypothetical protein